MGESEVPAFERLLPPVAHFSPDSPNLHDISPIGARDELSQRPSNGSFVGSGTNYVGGVDLELSRADLGISKLVARDELPRRPSQGSVVVSSRHSHESLHAVDTDISPIRDNNQPLLTLASTSKSPVNSGGTTPRPLHRGIYSPGRRFTPTTSQSAPRVALLAAEVRHRLEAVQSGHATAAVRVNEVMSENARLSSRNEALEEQLRSAGQSPTALPSEASGSIRGFFPSPVSSIPTDFRAEVTRINEINELTSENTALTARILSLEEEVRSARCSPELADASELRAEVDKLRAAVLGDREVAHVETNALESALEMVSESAMQAGTDLGTEREHAAMLESRVEVLEAQLALRPPVEPVSPEKSAAKDRVRALVQTATSSGAEERLRKLALDLDTERRTASGLRIALQESEEELQSERAAGGSSGASERQEAAKLEQEMERLREGFELVDGSIKRAVDDLEAERQIAAKFEEKVVFLEGQLECEEVQDGLKGGFKATSLVADSEAMSLEEAMTEADQSPAASALRSEIKQMKASQTRDTAEAEALLTELRDAKATGAKEKNEAKAAEEQQQCVFDDQLQQTASEFRAELVAAEEIITELRAKVHAASDLNGGLRRTEGATAGAGEELSEERQRGAVLEEEVAKLQDSMAVQQQELDAELDQVAREAQEAQAVRGLQEQVQSLEAALAEGRATQEHAAAGTHSDVIEARDELAAALLAKTESYAELSGELEEYRCEANSCQTALETLEASERRRDIDSERMEAGDALEQRAREDIASLEEQLAATTAQAEESSSMLRLEIEQLKDQERRLAGMRAEVNTSEDQERRLAGMRAEVNTSEEMVTTLRTQLESTSALREGLELAESTSERTAEDLNAERKTAAKYEEEVISLATITAQEDQAALSLRPELEQMKAARSRDTSEIQALEEELRHFQTLARREEGEEVQALKARREEGEEVQALKECLEMSSEQMQAELESEREEIACLFAKLKDSEAKESRWQPMRRQTPLRGQTPLKGATPMRRPLPDAIAISGSVGFGAPISGASAGEIGAISEANLDEDASAASQVPCREVIKKPSTPRLGSLQEKLREQRLKVDGGQSKIVQEHAMPARPETTSPALQSATPPSLSEGPREETSPQRRRTVTELEDKMRERRLKIEQLAPATAAISPSPSPPKEREDDVSRSAANAGAFSARGTRVDSMMLAPSRLQPMSPVPTPVGSEPIARIPIPYRDGMLASASRLQSAPAGYVGLPPVSAETVEVSEEPEPRTSIASSAPTTTTTTTGAEEEAPQYPEALAEDPEAFGAELGSSASADLAEGEDIASRSWTLEDLRDPLTWRGKGVDAGTREQLLSDETFVATFGMCKEDFAALPKWKRDKKKKDQLLF